MISPGSSRAISAASAGAVALGDAELAGRNVDPGEREAARRRRSTSARAGDREQIVVAPRVEQRVLGERAGRDQAHDVAPHHALARRASAPRRGLRAARRPRRDGRARSGDADIRRRDGSARRTSGCRGRDACRAWSARCRARARRSRRPRRTARRNRPSGRTAGNPDWRP